MYMAYGWPQAIPLLQGLCPASEQIIYLKVIGRFLLVVAPTHLELWSSSQHKVKLGKYMRDSDSVQKEGENSRAVWSPDTKNVAVITSSFILQLFTIQSTKKKLSVGGKQSCALFTANISLVFNEKAPLPDSSILTSNLVCDSKYIFLGLSSGSLILVSWKGELSGTFQLKSQHGGNSEVAVEKGLFTSQCISELSSYNKKLSNCISDSAIIHLELSLPLRLLIVISSSGQVVICSISKKGLRQTDSIRAENWLDCGDAVYAAIAPDQQILAVGCKRGEVELYSLAVNVSLIRTVSLHDWGYSVDDTGSVSSIAWTPDNTAFAVGYECRGLAVWSVSGCRLMSTIRQIGISSVTSPVVKSNLGFEYEPLMGGTAWMQWDENGYRLYTVEARSVERILSFSFGKCSLNRGVSGATYVRQLIYGEDRVLVVQSEDTDELKIVHLNLPVSYISQNWPILHMAASEDGDYLAIAGHNGMILYTLRHKKWRVFGDLTQEQMIECKGLLWLGKIVILCNYINSSNTYELLFYPRYHLDQSSLLCRKTLLGKPVVMDVFEEYILVTYRPFDLHIFHVKILGELSPAEKPVMQLSTVRELSIMSPKSHPVAMRLIPDPSMRKVISNMNNITSSNSLYRQPTRCLILRVTGELSLLDLDEGREHELTDSVELLWVIRGQSHVRENLLEEVSWLDYGHHGMQVWYPSPGADPFRQEDFLLLDPELEFDREVYPLGLLQNAGIVVGVSQRMSFSACAEFPCFEPSAQAQTILHCLLRHLLLRNQREEALCLAHLSAKKPHFSHCLEWLLFTVFDAEISRQNANRNQVRVSGGSVEFSLLEKACELIRNFPEYLDVVVSVARKTDGRHWANLFSAAGRSTELFEECFQSRWYRTAACYILVIAKLEGPAVSQYCALRLVQATLDESLYELAGELVRFLLRSGRDFETNSVDSDKPSPKFLSYFLFRSSFRRQSLDMKSPSVKEQSAHVASVKNILETHASYLMLGKELSKLVAFVKGTQFDLVEYLQREKNGFARLENFASGLELISQKLQMGTLQSRLDAEFLLAHMCSVKFKEWIVVLATLLRRSEVLVDLFRHDMRLWRAYSTTLLSQPSFSEYYDLLKDLEEQLSSAPALEE